ncbi:MAG: helix-turn-helix domain-containing protein [Saprospiraceae bacterium]|nr:helix-turn-helix domain-containing protein [Saprospiraceae bacterium]
MQSRPYQIAFIQKAAQIIIAHLEESDFSVNDLAKALHLSREQTHRKLKKQTGLSSGKFIRYIRLLLAYSYLKSESQSVQQVAYRTGFNNPAYFNTCFKEEWQCTPGEIIRDQTLFPSADLPILKFYQIPEIKEVLTKVSIVIEPGFSQRPERKRILHRKTMFTLFTLFGLIALWLSRGAADQVKFELDNQHLAVIPFVNNTGDTSLQVVGEIASSWISSQINNLGNVKTVPFFTVRQYSHYVGILPDDIEDRPTFAEVVDAALMIQGQYFLRDDEIYFDAELLDARTLESIYHLPMVHGARDSVMNLVEEMRLKIAGLITSIEEVRSGKLTPPNYDAYEYYLKGLQELSLSISPAALHYFEKAVVAEPDFVMPHLYRIWFYHGGERDSLFNIIEALPRMTAYERNVFRHLYLRHEHRYADDLELCLEMLNDYPKDYYFNMMAAHEAKSQFMPRFAMQILSQMEDKVESEVGQLWHLYKVRNYSESLMALGEYQEAIEHLEKIPSQLYNPAIPELMIYCNIRLGMGAENIEKLIAEYDHEDTRQIADLFANAAYEYILMNQDEDAHHFINRSMNLMINCPEESGYNFDQIDLFFMAGQFDIVRTKLERIKQINEVDYWVYMSLLEAATGDDEKALEIYEKTLTQEYIPWRRNPLAYQPDYLKARVYALLGREETSIDLLQRALEKGQLYHHLDFDRDIFLTQIFEVPRFQKLVRPREHGVDVTIMK